MQVSLEEVKSTINLFSEHKLGSGSFGEVMIGKQDIEGKELIVAVKLQTNLSNPDELLREFEAMKNIGNNQYLIGAIEYAPSA